MTTESALNKRPEETATTQVERTRSRPYFYPNVDIIETADELTVLADMPGMRPDDVDIQFENGTLTIHGTVHDRQPEGTSYLRREYGVGDFYRTFQVSELIDASKINAAYENGVLTLHLPKAEAAKPRKITVTSK